MPTRFIHSRSSLMPSLAMLPFIQCHQTRGLALSGGSRNPRSSGSAFCAETDHAMSRAAASEAQPIVRCMIDSYIARPRMDGDGPGLFPAGAGRDESPNSTYRSLWLRLGNAVCRYRSGEDTSEIPSPCNLL